MSDSNNNGIGLFGLIGIILFVVGIVLLILVVAGVITLPWGVFAGLFGLSFMCCCGLPLIVLLIIVIVAIVWVAIERRHFW